MPQELRVNLSDVIVALAVCYIVMRLDGTHTATENEYSAVNHS